MALGSNLRNVVAFGMLPKKALKLTSFVGSLVPSR